MNNFIDEPESLQTKMYGTYPDSPAKPEAQKTGKPYFPSAAPSTKE